MQNVALYTETSLNSAIQEEHVQENITDYNCQEQIQRNQEALCQLIC